MRGDGLAEADAGANARNSFRLQRRLQNGEVVGGVACDEAAAGGGDLFLGDGDARAVLDDVGVGHDISAGVHQETHPGRLALSFSSDAGAAGAMSSGAGAAVMSGDRRR